MVPHIPIFSRFGANFWQEGDLICFWWTKVCESKRREEV